MSSGGIDPNDMALVLHMLHLYSYSHMLPRLAQDPNFSCVKPGYISSGGLDSNQDTPHSPAQGTGTAHAVFCTAILIC